MPTKFSPAEKCLIDNYPTYYQMWQVEERIDSKLMSAIKQAMEDLQNHSWAVDRSDLSFEVYEDSNTLVMWGKNWKNGKKSVEVQFCVESVTCEYTLAEDQLPYSGIWIGHGVAESDRKAIARALRLNLNHSIRPMGGVDSQYRKEWIVMKPLYPKKSIGVTQLEPAKVRHAVVAAFDELAEFIPALDKYFKRKKRV